MCLLYVIAKHLVRHLDADDFTRVDHFSGNSYANFLLLMVFEFMINPADLSDKRVQLSHFSGVLTRKVQLGLRVSLVTASCSHAKAADRVFSPLELCTTLIGSRARQFLF